MSAKLAPGYPHITDPEHPLWDEQQAGWPNMTPIEAMRAAVEHKPSGGHADSSTHPAFDKRYIQNDHATPAQDDPVRGVADQQPGKTRR